MHRTFGVVTLLFLGSGLHLRMVAPARAADCNNNGIEDAVELAVCPPVDVVFIMDTSQSMNERGIGRLCDHIRAALDDLAQDGLTVNAERLRILSGAKGCQCCEDTVAKSLRRDDTGTPRGARHLR